MIGQIADEMGVYLPGVDSGVGEESTPAISESESESDSLDFSPSHAVSETWKDATDKPLEYRENTSVTDILVEI
jgi:hypothetical protein